MLIYIDNVNYNFTFFKNKVNKMLLLNIKILNVLF